MPGPWTIGAVPYIARGQSARQQTVSLTLDTPVQTVPLHVLADPDRWSVPENGQRYRTLLGRGDLMFKVAGLLFALALLLAGLARAAVPPTPPAVAIVGGAAALSLSAASARVALPSSTNIYPAALLINDGGVTAFLAFGDSSVSATTAGLPVQAGGCMSIWLPNGVTYVAGITAAASTTLRVVQLNGGATASCPASAIQATTTPSGIPGLDTPTVQNVAYSLGDCIGGFRSVSIAASNGGPMYPTAFSINSTGGITGPISVYLFNANPSTSTCNDHNAFALSAADKNKVIAYFSITLTTSAGTAATFGRQTFSPPIIATAAAGSQLMYYGLIAGAALTPAATNDISTRTEALH